MTNISAILLRSVLVRSHFLCFEMQQENNFPDPVVEMDFLCKILSARSVLRKEHQRWPQPKSRRKYKFLSRFCRQILNEFQFLIILPDPN